MDISCRDFVSALGSSAPAPGGGGASALVGAVGVALGNMVGCLTIGKKKYAQVEEEMIDLCAQAERLQDQFLTLMVQDEEVFKPLAKAYGMPSQTEEEKKIKAEVMEKCLLDACSVPMEIMKCCGKAIDLHRIYEEKGTVMALSDVGVGVVMCKAALIGASLNVFINTGSMKDRQVANRLTAEAETLVAEYSALADKIYNRVRERL